MLLLLVVHASPRGRAPLHSKASTFAAAASAVGCQGQSQSGLRAVAATVPHSDPQAMPSNVGVSGGAYGGSVDAWSTSSQRGAHQLDVVYLLRGEIRLHQAMRAHATSHDQRRSRQRRAQSSEPGRIALIALHDARGMSMFLSSAVITVATVEWRAP